MARVSRKVAAITKNTISALPERIYHVAAYVRLSAEDNHYTKDRESLSTQQDMLERYILQQPDMLLYQVYSDNGESGTDFARSGFECMMNEIRKRKVDCIVVKDLSRFGRNYVETGYYLEKLFPYLGVRFVAVNDHYDTKKDKDELVLSLKNLMNDLYAKDISQKIGSALFTRQKNGEFIGAFPPYGYLKSPEDKHKLIIDPDVAAIVHDIFQRRQDGEEVNQIACYLNKKKIPSPSMYHYQKGHKKKRPKGTATIWQGQTIRQIIANPVYAGHMAQGKTKKSLCSGIPKTKVPDKDWIIVKNTHEALVSQEIFDRIQRDTKRHYQTTKNYWIEKLNSQTCVIKDIRELELKEIIIFSLYIQFYLSGEHFQKKRKKFLEKIEKIQQKIKRYRFLRVFLFESYCNHMLTEAEYFSIKEKYDREEQMMKLEQFEIVSEKMIEELVQNIDISRNNEINLIWNFQDEFIHLTAQKKEEVE